MDSELIERGTSRIKSGLLRQLEQAGERRDEDVMSALSYVAWRNAQIAKHEHFSEEEEWRYVVSAPPADTQYRISGFGLTPFLPTDELSIEEVWVGPCVGPDPATARLTAEEFLGQLGIEAKVSYWKSPLRR